MKLLRGFFVALLALNSLCAARTVLVMGERGGYQDYCLMDHTVLERHYAGNLRYAGKLQTQAYLDVDLATVDRELKGKPEVLFLFCNNAPGMDDWRVSVSLWVPTAFTSQQRIEAWSRGGRLLLRQATLEKGDKRSAWRRILAAGACIVASHINDVGTDLFARAVVSSMPLKRAYEMKRPDDVLGVGVDPIVLAAIPHEKGGSISFVEADLLREVVGPRMYFRLHESGVFALAHAWGYGVQEIFEQWRDRGEISFFKGASDGIGIWARATANPQELWGKVIACTATLKESAYLVGHLDGGRVFASWGEAAFKTIELLMRTGEKGVGYGSGKAIVRPASPDEKKAGEKARPSLEIPDHLLKPLVGPDSPTGSPKVMPPGEKDYDEKTSLLGGANDKK